MRLEHESLKRLKQDIREVVGRHLDLSEYKVFFFGSRVEGRGDERSDIDLGIEGPKRIPAAARAAIEEELENAYTLYKIELVDFATVSDEFKNIAKRAIEPIN